MRRIPGDVVSVLSTDVCVLIATDGDQEWWLTTHGPVYVCQSDYKHTIEGHHLDGVQDADEQDTV